MKLNITITKQEIEKAVKDYVEDRVKASYAYELGQPDLWFNNQDGTLGYFTCDVSLDVYKEGEAPDLVDEAPLTKEHSTSQRATPEAHIDE